MQIPDTSFEQIYWNQDQYTAGIDEAGRGPLAGPVVAAAVVLPKYFRHSAIKDSKKLSPSKRNELCGLILEKSISHGIGIVESYEIDRINILQATLKAMKIAVSKLDTKPDSLLIDGINKIDSEIEQITIKKGDSRCLSIAAASIIAKVTRDKIMLDYDSQYPQFNFKKHKGYPTKEHLDLIKHYGISKIHRKTFKGVL